MTAAPSNFDSIRHPIEFVHSHMVEDGPVERFMEPGTGLVQLPDQPDTLTKDGEIPISPETRLGEPPAADAIPENAVDHVQGGTHDEGVTESSGTRNAAGVAPDDYHSSDQSPELIEDPTLSKEEYAESDGQPEAQHTSYTPAHAPNAITTRPQDDVSSPYVHEKHIPTLVTDVDIEPAKDIPNDIVRHGDVGEGPSVDLTGHVQAVDITESLDTFGSSGGDLSTETNSKPVNLPDDVGQAVTVGDGLYGIPMRDVEHASASDECSRSLDRPSPYPSIDILRPQGTPEKHGEDSIVTEENSPGSPNKGISHDVTDMHEGLSDHASEAEGTLVLVGELPPSPPAGVRPTTNGQEYEDIGAQHPPSQSPPQYSSDKCDNIEDAWARHTSHRGKVLSPAREYPEPDHRVELSPATVTYDSWDAPQKFANGLISAGDGPFLLGGDPITHFVRDTIPAVFAFLEIPKVSSRVQESVDVDVGVPFGGHNTDVHGYNIESERSNSDLNDLYDGLQSEPIEGIEREIGQIFGA